MPFLGPLFLVLKPNVSFQTQSINYQYSKTPLLRPPLGLRKKRSLYWGGLTIEIR